MRSRHTHTHTSHTHSFGVPDQLDLSEVRGVTTALSPVVREMLLADPLGDDGPGAVTPAAALSSCITTDGELCFDAVAECLAVLASTLPAGATEGSFAWAANGRRGLTAQCDLKEGCVFRALPV